MHEEERAPALVQPRRMALRKAHNLIMQPVGEFRLPSHWSAVSLHETSRLNGLELHQHVEVATAVPGRGPWDQGRHDDVDGRCSAEQLSGNAPLLEERHRLPIERHEAVTPKPLPFVGDHRIGEITTRLQLRQPRLHRSTQTNSHRAGKATAICSAPRSAAMAACDWAGSSLTTARTSTLVSAAIFKTRQPSRMWRPPGSPPAWPPWRCGRPIGR